MSSDLHNPSAASLGPDDKADGASSSNVYMGVLRRVCLWLGIALLALTLLSFVLLVTMAVVMANAPLGSASGVPLAMAAVLAFFSAVPGFGLVVLSGVKGRWWTFAMVSSVLGLLPLTLFILLGVSLRA